MTTHTENPAAVVAEPASLVECVRRRAQDQPGRTAFTFLLDGEEEEVSLTYAGLDERARAVAAMLQDGGMSGERLLLIYPPGLEYVEAFLGCLYAGAAAVPAYPPRASSHAQSQPLARLRAIVRDARPAAALTSRAVLAAVEPRVAQEPDMAGLRLLATDDLPSSAASGWAEPEIRPDTLAFLQYTSGSTAAPKGVMVSHGNLLANERMIRDGFGRGEDSTGVGWLPLYHDMGLIGNVLQPLYTGSPVVLMSPAAFLQRPLRWLRAVSRYRAHTSGGPNFAYDLCARKVTEEQKEGLDLSSWRVAFNGAEPIRPDTLEEFSAAFAGCGFRREAFYPCYGLAEATLFVTGGAWQEAPVLRRVDAAGLERGEAAAPADGDEGARTLVGCGRAAEGARVSVVDPETLEECADGAVGEIWVSGPNVAGGYWDNAAATESTFRARTAGGAGPFLRTGDLGFLDGGELFVTGRLKDLIIVDGRNHYPQDIELTAEQSHPALLDHGAAAFSVEVAGKERVVVAAEVERHFRPPRPAGPEGAGAAAGERPAGDAEEVVRAIRRAVSQHHELQVHDVVLLRFGGLPKTSSGKVQRHACRAGYLDRTLNVWGART